MCLSKKNKINLAALQQWKAQGKRGIWLRLNLARAQLINVAVDAGFDFRHAQKGHVIMTKWLSSDLPDLLPDSATHQVRYSLLWDLLLLVWSLQGCYSPEKISCCAQYMYLSAICRVRCLTLKVLAMEA